MKSIKNIPKSIKIGILIGIPPFNRSGVVFSVTELSSKQSPFQSGSYEARRCGECIGAVVQKTTMHFLWELELDPKSNLGPSKVSAGGRLYGP